MCLPPDRPPGPSAELNCALDIAWADERWQSLHSPLGEVSNLARTVFTNPAASWFFLDHQQVQVAVVAQLRGSSTPAAAHHRACSWPAQPAEHERRTRARRREVVDELQRSSAPFERLWSGLHVSYRARTAYTVHHPDLGPLTLERLSTPQPDGSWRERIQAPEGSRAAEVLTLLDLV